MPGEQRVHWRTARRDRTPSSREALQVVADGGVLHRGGVRGACERRGKRAVDRHRPFSVPYFLPYTVQD